jgi:hypothetical protein
MVTKWHREEYLPSKQINQKIKSESFYSKENELNVPPELRTVYYSYNIKKNLGIYVVVFCDVILFEDINRSRIARRLGISIRTLRTYTCKAIPRCGLGSKLRLFFRWFDQDDISKSLKINKKPKRKR